MEQKDSAERILKQIPYEIVYSARKTLAVQVKAVVLKLHQSGPQGLLGASGLAQVFGPL